MMKNGPIITRVGKHTVCLDEHGQVTRIYGDNGDMTYDADEDGLLSECLEDYDNDEDCDDSDLSHDVDERQAGKYQEKLRSRPKKPNLSASVASAFAEEALDALEASGSADFVLLKNDKLREWWAAVKNHRAFVAAEDARNKQEAIEKELALEKWKTFTDSLSDSEKKHLGMGKKTSPNNLF